MTVVHVGSLSIGDAVPAAATVSAAGVSGINGALPDLTARLLALASFSPAPVNFALQLALAQSTVASIQSAIALGLPAPSIAAQIAEVAAQVAALEAVLASVEANLATVVDVQAQLSVAGLHSYVYTGDVGDLGAEFTTELAGGLPGGAPTAAASAVLLITTSPAAWAAMEQVFRVTP